MGKREMPKYSVRIKPGGEKSSLKPTQGRKQEDSIPQGLFKKADAVSHRRLSNEE